MALNAKIRQGKVHFHIQQETSGAKKGKKEGKIERKRKKRLNYNRRNRFRASFASQ